MGGWDDKPLGEGRSAGKHVSKFAESSLTKTVCIQPVCSAQRHTTKLLFQSGVRNFQIYALRKEQCHDSVLRTNSNLLLSLLSQGAASCLCKHVKVIPRISITVLEGAECATDTVCAQVCNQRRKNSEPVK